MLTFYYAPLSLNARRVWVALLEKQIAFNPILVKLDGEQFSPEFSAINPLQRVPVIVDNGCRVVESLAILDYLEVKYPEPSLLPNQPQALAKVRMAENLILHEIQPATLPLMRQLMQMPIESEKIKIAQERIRVVLNFFEQDLIEGNPYFLGNQLTLADIVAGTALSVLPLFGFELSNYPKLQVWIEELNQRPSWQQTTPKPEELAAAQASIREILQRRDF